MTLELVLPQVWLDIAFARDPLDDSPLWVNVNPWVQWHRGVKISRRRSHELDQVSPGTMTLELLNSDGRFTPDRPDSPYYPNVKINRPIRVRARWPISPNLLYSGQATASNASMFAASDGDLAVDLAVIPPGFSFMRSIRWSGVLWNGELLYVGGSTVSTPTDQAITVTEGQPYAVQCLARRGATGPSMVRMFIRWYDVAGDQLGDSVGADVTLTTSWQPVTATGTAPAGAEWARVVVEHRVTPGASIDVYVAALQFEQAPAPTTWTSPGREFIRYRGYVDRWPLAWYNGVLGYAAITCTNSSKILARASLDDALADFQLSGERIADLLTIAGITDLEHIDNGLSQLRLSGQEEGQKIAPLIRACEVSEAGLFFFRSDGLPAFHDRGRRQAVTNQVLELPAHLLGSDLTIQVDDALLYNDITVRAFDGTEHRSLGATSIGEYGRYSYTLDTLLPADQIIDRGRAMFRMYEEPRPRAAPITIAAHQVPELWLDLLFLEIGDRVQVTDLPPEAPSDLLDLWVEGISEVIGDSTWEMALDTSPLSGTAALTLDHFGLGRLDENVLGW
ncbi:hypothetical protein HNP84_007319 [Thermocatellispora tengchongensis]|uniref:Uncharacterized protein n=1 Tax=Thermocatellispora tengchongensis TaxID=1073253 RepID=A0A840PKH0_9ACTN|nr:hypothetical protein [Thermocatellispora tengchongensis]MBB5137567.1 hypothetical protein [Thermocatellispora tengchongensis]